LTKVLNGVPENYSYDVADKLLSAGSKSYSYDGAGNLISVVSGGQTTTLSYDAANRLTQITYPGGATNTFTYNGFGQRVGKSGSLGARTFLYDGADVLSDGAAFYTWVVDGLGSERRSGVSRWTHADGLWSTRKLTNSSQSITDTFGTDAFGLVTSRTGTTPTPFRFVGGLGYQADPDSGVYLLGHRYEDPSIGRFITSDPIRDGLNWYVYVQNKPGQRGGLQWIVLAGDWRHWRGHDRRDRGRGAARRGPWSGVGELLRKSLGWGESNTSSG